MKEYHQECFYPSQPFSYTMAGIAGFDTRDYPGDDIMQWLYDNTNLYWGQDFTLHLLHVREQIEAG
jgi:hypothetical protein